MFPLWANQYLWNLFSQCLVAGVWGLWFPNLTKPLLKGLSRNGICLKQYTNNLNHQPTANLLLQKYNTKKKRIGKHTIKTNTCCCLNSTQLDHSICNYKSVSKSDTTFISRWQQNHHIWDYQLSHEIQCLEKNKKQRIFCELLPSENWQLGPAGCYHWQEVYQLTVQQSPPTRLQLGLTGPNVGPKDLSIREISWFNESTNSTNLQYV